MPTKTEKPKKANFSSFDKRKAFKQLNITDLIPWTIDAPPKQPSLFFQQRLDRLNRFDLEDYEESKKLLIDAICEEALEGCDRLKIWKGAKIESDTLTGNVDYVIAERKRYLEAPLLCIIEAKKDDFEQGMAQCLVEMQACQWENQQIDRLIDIIGIVTNGEGWKFYQLKTSGSVSETLLYSRLNLDMLMGTLHALFQECEQNLSVQTGA